MKWDENLLFHSIFSKFSSQNEDEIPSIRVDICNHNWMCSWPKNSIFAQKSTQNLPTSVRQVQLHGVLPEVATTLRDIAAAHQDAGVGTGQPGEIHGEFILHVLHGRFHTRKMGKFQPGGE
jgi:hypothetical protein